MKREILFRGKRVCGGEWVEGFFIIDPLNTANIVCVDMDYCEAEWYEVDPETVGQYTGLKDQSGVRIFEGDLVRWTTKFNTTSTRVHEDVMTWCDFGRWMLEPWIHEPQDAYMEVIGNTHDTRENIHE